MDLSDSINRANADYIEQLYQKYQTDPRSVEPHWQAFFAGFDAGSNRLTDGHYQAAPASGATVAAQAGQAGQEAAARGDVLSIELQDLVHSYRELGHFVATLDPLGHHRPSHPLLELQQFGLSNADLDRVVGRGGFRGPTD